MNYANGGFGTEQICRPDLNAGCAQRQKRKLKAAARQARQCNAARSSGDWAGVSCAWLIRPIEENGKERDRLNCSAHAGDSRSSFKLIALTMERDYTPRRLRLKRYSISRGFLQQSGVTPMQTRRTLPLGQKGAKKFLSDPIRWIYLFLRNCPTDGRAN